MEINNTIPYNMDKMYLVTPKDYKTFLSTLIYFISYIEGNQDDPKGIKITDKLFHTSSQFNLSAISIMMITAFLYAFFW